MAKGLMMKKYIHAIVMGLGLAASSAEAGGMESLRLICTPEVTIGWNKNSNFLTLGNMQNGTPWIIEPINPVEIVVSDFLIPRDVTKVQMRHSMKRVGENILRGYCTVDYELVPFVRCFGVNDEGQLDETNVFSAFKDEKFPDLVRFYSRAGSYAAFFVTEAGKSTFKQTDTEVGQCNTF